MSVAVRAGSIEVKLHVKLVHDYRAGPLTKPYRVAPEFTLLYHS